MLGIASLCLATSRGCPIAAGLSPKKLTVVAAGVGPKWDRYVEYIHRLAQRVQTDCQAEPAVASGKKLPAEEVTGWVLLNRHGEVTEIIELDGPDALVDPIRSALAAGIAEHHNYGIWPEEMVKALGEDRQVAMGFYFPGAAPAATAVTPSSDSSTSFLAP